MAQTSPKIAIYTTPLTPESRSQLLSSSSPLKDGSQTPPRVQASLLPSYDPVGPECIREKHLAAKLKAQRRYSQQMQASLGRLPGPLPSPFFTFHMPSPNQQAKQAARAGKKPRVSAPAVTNPFFRLYPDSEQPYKRHNATIQPPKRPKRLETHLDLPSSDDIAPVTLELAEDETDTMQLDNGMRNDSSEYQLDDPFEY
ncbi:hypothetical protein FRC17_002179 [Serendipita sp. 399]|nr:hypothetical protein FRC17_002179 [Serendipita sp. 399]